MSLPGATLPPEMAAMKSKKNPTGVGRHPRAGERASVRIALRLTPAEHTRWTAAAEVEGVTLGDFVRAACEVRVQAARVEVAHRTNAIRGKRAALKRRT